MSLNPNVVLRHEPQFYSTYAAFDSKRILTHFYDSERYYILECLAKKPSELSALRAEGVTLGESELRAFINQELISGFIVKLAEKESLAVHVPSRPERGAFDGFPTPFLSAPSTVDLFLTRACNLRCCHCFADGGRPLKEELSHEEWLSLFDQLEEMGVLQVRLTGGEPFMRRRILEILDYLRTKRFQKLLITNGTMLNERTVDSLVKSEITPTVSLDGATAEVHDAFRGVPGAFRRTLRGIAFLRRSGMMYGLNTCVHSGNVGQIEDIVRIGAEMGATRIGLLGLQQAGRAVKTRAVSLSGVENLMLSLRFTRLARRYKERIEVTQELFDETPLDSVGTFTCSIDSDGAVYPTNIFLGNLRYRIGSVRGRPFREVWFSRDWIPFRKRPLVKSGSGPKELSWKVLSKAA